MDQAPLPEISLICNDKQLAYLTERMRQRKSRLLEDIRRVLARSGNERDADLVGGAGDAGDESVASLLRDVAEAEVVRDIGEVRDIVAAEERIAAGRYGMCIDCGSAIDYERLEATRAPNAASHASSTARKRVRPRNTPSTDTKAAHGVIAA